MHCEKVVWAEIDREARKGKPLLRIMHRRFIDIKTTYSLFDAGWASVGSRIARVSESSNEPRPGCEFHP